MNTKSEPTRPIDPEIEAAWLKEAQKRLREYEEGKVEAIPGEQVMERLRAITQKG